MVIKETYLQTMGLEVVACISSQVAQREKKKERKERKRHMK